MKILKPIAGVANQNACKPVRTFNLFINRVNAKSYFKVVVNTFGFG